MIGRAERLAYMVSQTARISWYGGQYRLAARLGRRTRPQRAPLPEGTVLPSAAEMTAELRQLMQRDLGNIEAGYYRLPHDLIEPPGKALRDAIRFFRDLPEVDRRRATRANAEVFEAQRAAGSRLPRYYLQNFHYQTDGYLSDHSARLYDHQVEVLFGGGADAMRRQALVPIHHFLRERPSNRAWLLDVGAGTGRFLTFVKDNYPRLHVTALDLSPHYLAEARRNLAPWRGAGFVQAPAEAIPLADGSVDLVTCIYLFHELPRKVRHAAAAEMARVLAPGGLLVFMDSLQKGDRAGFDGLLDLFPAGYHEPYYADYIRQDLTTLFAEAGLRTEAVELAFMSKLVILKKRT
jgi:ubiquinone/menaquinone biosynthesis C-methylase UbiE